MPQRTQTEGIETLLRDGLSDEAVEEMTGLALADIIVLRAQAAAAAAASPSMRRVQVTEHQRQ